MTIDFKFYIKNKEIKSLEDLNTEFKKYCERQQEYYDNLDFHDTTRYVLITKDDINHLKNLQESRFKSSLNIQNCDLRDVDLSAMDLSNSCFEGSNLSGSNLNKTNFTNSILTDVNFVESNIEDAEFLNANLTNAVLSDLNEMATERIKKANFDMAFTVDYKEGKVYLLSNSGELSLTTQSAELFLPIPSQPSNDNESTQSVSTSSSVKSMPSSQGSEISLTTVLSDSNASKGSSAPLSSKWSSTANRTYKENITITPKDTRRSSSKCLSDFRNSVLSRGAGVQLRS